VPEMNLGQLALLLRGKYLVDVKSYTSVRGAPISVDDICRAVLDLTVPDSLDEEHGDRKHGSARSTARPQTLTVGASR